ncbi:MAG: 23S rRNA (uridine2552-2'-O)-methyltransferase [Oceanicoccus sp.]|jgi:23S rRNA (uridine2552-2'-O)-methyltransferase
MSDHFVVQDEFFNRAKTEGYRARSAFKLKEIQTKFKLIKKGHTVVDLGAAPGSFMQVILRLVGSEGNVFGIDLQEIESFDVSNAHSLKADIYNKDQVIDALKQAGFEKIDVLTSDLAPKTTGIKDIDQGRSAELTDQALYIATQLLKPGGHFVGKVFEGADFQWLLRRVKRRFKKVSVFKPSSCRDRSFETYIIGIGFKP